MEDRKNSSIRIGFHSYKSKGSKKNLQKSNPFRYEQMWERVNMLQPAIEKSLKKRVQAGNLRQVGEKLSMMQRDLRDWAQKDFGLVLKQTTEIRKRLSILWNLPYSHEQQREVNKLSKDLDELLLREELMWRQRSRVTFIREGDRNSKWFQSKSTWRNKKNNIIKLKDSSGVWIEDKSGLEEMTNSFFKELYEKEGGVTPNEIMDLFDVKVMQEMNDMLK